MNVHLNCNDEQLLVPLISQANTFQIALNYFNLLQILSLLSVLVHPGYLARPIVGTKTEITYEAETKYNILRLIFLNARITKNAFKTYWRPLLSGGASWSWYTHMTLGIEQIILLE